MQDTNINITEKSDNADMEDINKKIEGMSFREAMDELKRVVEVLESNTLELEDSLEKYQYGVALLSACKKRLDGAQIKVEEMMEKIEAEQISDKQRDSTLS